MSNMNGRKRDLFSSDNNTTLNHEGSTVHQLDYVEILFNKVMGSFFGENTYYENRDAFSDFKEVCSIVHNLSEKDKEYALKIALLGRSNGMIQYPLALLTACFNWDKYKGSNFVDEQGHNAMRKYYDKIVLRGKDVVDVMTYQMKGMGCNPTDRGRSIPLPMQLRKCMKSRLEDLSDYTLSKGLCEGNDVSLADCIKMLRPNPVVHRNNGNRESFYKEVIENRVSFADGQSQVQTELVKYGQGKQVDMDELAETLRDSSLMAVVKNLVAIIRVGGFDDIVVTSTVCDMLSNPALVKKSRLLPFRFYSAYKAVFEQRRSCKYINMVLDSLEKALDLSCDNMDSISGYNAILLDRSGSMRHSISDKSDLTAAEIGLLLCAIVMKHTNGDVYVFGTSCKKVPHINTSMSSLLRIMKHIEREEVGGGTYIDVALETVEKSMRNYNNLIILTDGDIYTSTGKNSFNISTYSGRGYSSSCDDLVNSQMKRGVYNRLFLNNLLGNSFSAVNSDCYRKNLVVSFTDKFVDMINMYINMSRSGGNVRGIIDRMATELLNS